MADIAEPLPAAALSGASDLSVRIRRSAEYIAIPAVCSRGVGVAVLAVPADARQIPARFLRTRLSRRVWHRVLDSEHPAALRATHSHRARGRGAGAHRAGHDRRGGRAGGRRVRRRRARDPAGRRQGAAHSGAGADGDCGRRRWRDLDRDRRLPASRPRRQRDDLLAADDLHRHRHHELLRRRARCAI